MRKGYSSDRSQDLRRLRPEIVVFVVLTLLFALIIVVVYLDLNKRELAIDNSKNQEVLSTFNDNIYPYKTVETSKFSVDIPEPWIRITDPEIRLSGKTYYPVRYQGVDGREVGRRVDVYVDEIPVKLPINKLLTVEVRSNTHISAKLLSPQCYTFTKHPLTQKGEAFDSSWMGHSFTCLTARQSNTISIAQDHYRDGVVLDGQDGASHVVTFAFTDHSGNANNAIFNRIVESFRLK